MAMWSAHEKQRCAAASAGAADAGRPALLQMHRKNIMVQSSG